jgi:hypothetical protein
MNEELREKVIKGLELLHKRLLDASVHDRIAILDANMVSDAIALLKAQEPRVMTLDDIGNALKMPLWKETKRAHKDLYTGWVLPYDIQKGEGITGTRLGMSEPSGRVVWYRLDDYGTTWRCWTAEPTEEQRKAVKWDE